MYPNLKKERKKEIIRVASSEPCVDVSDRRKDRPVTGTVQKWLKQLTQDSIKLFPYGHGNDLGWDFLKAPDVVM